MKDIIVIGGPTGVGKTKLSVELAKKINAEIINADSMQVYKELDIATAKIKEEEKDGIVHHLFDIVDVNINYTVFDYQRDARRVIDDILSRGKRVILVGGTGLYIKACLYNYCFDENKSSSLYEEFSNEEILSKINNYNIAHSVHVNNRQRLVRLLNKLEDEQDLNNTGNDKLYDFEVIGLTTDRENLYNIINKRVSLMCDDGLVEEAKSLYDRDIHTKAIYTGIGYKELYKYFDGDISLDVALNNIRQNSRRYAKRQYTFFNHQLDVTWFNTNYDDFSETINEVYNYLQDIEKTVK